jgi:tRNA dimethylallyltransferase
MLNFLRSFWRIKRPSTMEPLIAVVGATGTGKSKVRETEKGKDH